MQESAPAGVNLYSFCKMWMYRDGMDLGDEVEELRAEAVVAEVVRLRLRLGGGGRGERDSSSAHGRRSLLPHRDSALSVTRILCVHRAVQSQPASQLRRGLICNGGKEMESGEGRNKEPRQLCLYLGFGKEGRGSCDLGVRFLEELTVIDLSVQVFIMPRKRRGCLGRWAGKLEY